MALLQVLRGFDGILFAKAIIIVLLLHPSFGLNELGNPDILCILPVIVIGWFSHQLPLTFSEIKNWDKIVLTLRLIAITLVGFIPFSIWRYTVPNNAYFLVNSQLAIIFGMSLLLQVNTLILILARYTESKWIARGALTVKFLIFYFLLVPFLALMVTYFLDSYIYSITTFEDFYTIIGLSPSWLRLFIFMPVGLYIFLLFQIRHILTKHLISMGNNI